MGKTAFALHFVLSAAKQFKKSKENKSLLFFSLKMSRKQLVKRVISSVSGIDYKNLRNEDLEEEKNYNKWERIENERWWNKNLLV